MSLIDTIDKNTEHAELAEKIASGKIDFNELVESIMRGETQVHSVDLQDMVNEALGDDNVAYHAKQLITASIKPQIIGELDEFHASLAVAVSSEIKNAIKNIVTDHYPMWGKD